VTDFCKALCWLITGNKSFYYHKWKTLPLLHLYKNCIAVFCDHYHGNMQVKRDFLGGNLMLHISTTFCIHSNTIFANLLQKKRIITNTCVLRNSGSIANWHILKRGHLLKHNQIQLNHWYCDLCLIFNGELIHKHCLTGIIFIKARMVCPQKINFNWYCLMLLTYPQRMYQKNWPLASERFLIMVGLFMQNIMANQPLATHLGLSNTKLALVSFFHAVTKLDICHQHMTRSSVCLDTLFLNRKQKVSQDQCHINKISMTVYFCFNVYQSRF